MSKAFSFVLLVILFDLVVIGVEDYRQLNRFDVLLVDLILSDAQLFDAEILFQGSAYQRSASFVDAAVVEVQFDQSLVAQNQFGNVLGASEAQVAIPEIEILQPLVLHQALA